MKILIQRNNKQKLASKIAAASFIKQGIPANDILFLEFENNALLNSKIGKKYLREGKIKIFKNDLQSFTLLRFYGPEFVHYKEKILIIDPDVFAIKNPKNISYFLDDNNSLACTFINHEPRSEVMLVNAEKVKWKFNEIIGKLFNLEIDYKDLMNLSFDKSLKIVKKRGIPSATEHLKTASERPARTDFKDSRRVRTPFRISTAPRRK